MTGLAARGSKTHLFRSKPRAESRPANGHVSASQTNCASSLNFETLAISRQTSSQR